MTSLFNGVQKVEKSLLGALNTLSTLPLVGRAIESGLETAQKVASFVSTVESDFLPASLVTVGSDYYLPIEISVPVATMQPFGPLTIGSSSKPLLNIKGNVSLYADIDLLLEFTPDGSGFDLNLNTDLATFAAQYGHFQSSYSPSPGNKISLSALPDEPLAFRVVATIPGFTGSFNLDGLLSAQASDLGYSNDKSLGTVFKATIGFGLDFSNGVSAPTFAGDFDLGLGLTLSLLPSADSNSPFDLQFRTDLAFDWHFGDSSSNFQNAGSITGGFSNFQINLGSLFGASGLLGGPNGLISQLQKYTVPLEPLFGGPGVTGALNEDIPILDHFGIHETFLQAAVAAGFAPDGPLLDDITLINNFSTNANGWLPVPGTFKMADPRPSIDPSFLTKGIANSSKGSLVNSAESMLGGDDGGEFAADFPILSDPAGNLASLLMGNPITFFTFDAAASFNVDVDVPFGIAGLFDVGFKGDLAVSGELAGGYDSTGLMKFLSDHNLKDLANGFYFDAKTTNLTISGSLALYSDLAIVHLEGGIFGDVVVQLMPGGSNRDKVYLSDLGTNLSRVFVVSGDLDARAVLSVGIDPPDPLPSITFFSWTLADVSLLPSDFDFDPGAQPAEPPGFTGIITIPLTSGIDTIYVHPYVSNQNMPDGSLRQTLGIEVDSGGGNETQYPMYLFHQGVPGQQDGYVYADRRNDPAVFAISTGDFDLSGTHQIIVNLGTTSEGYYPFGNTYPMLLFGSDSAPVDYIEHLPVLLIGGPGDDDLEYTGQGSAVMFGGGGDDRLVSNLTSILVGGPGNNDLEGAGVEVADRVDQASQSISFPSKWVIDNWPEPNVDSTLTNDVANEVYYEQFGGPSPVFPFFPLQPPPDNLQGHSVLAAGGSDPKLYAGPGGDTLITYTFGSVGNPFVDAALYGGAGNDTFEVEGAGDFLVQGGGGQNTLIVEDAAEGDTLGQGTGSGTDHMDVSYNTVPTIPYLNVDTANNQTNATVQSVSAFGIQRLSLKPAGFDSAITVENMTASPVTSLAITVPDDGTRPPIKVTIDGSSYAERYVTGQVVQPTGLVATTIQHSEGFTLAGQPVTDSNLFAPFVQTFTLLGLVAQDDLVLDGGARGTRYDVNLDAGQAFAFDAAGTPNVSNSVIVRAEGLGLAPVTGQLSLNNAFATYGVTYAKLTNPILKFFNFQQTPDNFIVVYGNIADFEFYLGGIRGGNDVTVNQSEGIFAPIAPATTVVHASAGGGDRFTVTDPENVAIDGGSGAGSTLTLNDNRLTARASYVVQSNRVTDTRTLSGQTTDDETVSYSNLSALTLNAVKGTASNATVDVESVPAGTTVNGAAQALHVDVSPQSENLDNIISSLVVNGLAGYQNVLDIYDNNNPYSNSQAFLYQISQNNVLTYTDLPGLGTAFPGFITFSNLAQLNLDAGDAVPNLIQVTSPAVPLVRLFDSHSGGGVDTMEVFSLAGELEVDAPAQTHVLGPLEVTNSTLAAIHGSAPAVGTTFPMIYNNSFLPLIGAFSNFAPGATQTMNGLRYQMAYNVNLGIGDKLADDAVLTYENTPPAITTLTVPQIAHEAIPVAVGVTFSDPDALDTHMVTVSWGDGSPAQAVSLAAGVLTTGLGHSYPQARAVPYSVRITVADSNGGTVQASGTIRVYDAPLELIPSVVPTIYANAPFNGEVAEFVDLGTPLVASAYQATINWGDGTTSAGIVTAAGSNAYTVHGSHTGAFPVGTKLAFSVQITDPGGAQVLGPLTWQSGPASMDVARQGESAVTGRDGKIYVLGGVDSNGTPLAAFESYDPATNAWTNLPNVPTPLAGMTAAADANGNIFVFGGQPLPSKVKNPNLSASSQVLRFDPETKLWLTMAPLPEGTSFASAVFVGGSIYILGGQTILAGAARFLNAVQVYNPSQNTWTTLASGMPTARSHLAAVAGSDGLIYAVGGTRGGSTGLTTVEVLDPSTETWSTAPGLSQGREDLALATGPLGYLYAIGGSAGGKLLSSVESFEPQIESWVPASGLPTVDSALAAAAAGNGRIYETGGTNGAAVLASTLVLQPVTLVVKDAPLLGQGEPVTADAGIPFTESLARFAQIGGDSSRYTVVVTWGDGSSSPGSVQANTDGTFTASGSHQYSSAGTYSVHVWVVDSEGSQATFNSLAFVQLPAPVPASLMVTLQAGETGAINPVATFTDPHPKTAAGDFTAVVTWDDGESDPASVQPGTNGGYLVVASKSSAYPVAGRHSVIVSIGYNSAGPDHFSGAGSNVTSPVQVVDAPSSSDEIVISSDTSWQVYSDAALTNLRGNAMDVVLNDLYPIYPRPAGAFNFNDTGGVWGATTASNDPDGAQWVWAPGITLADPAQGATYYFTKTFKTGVPVSGSIYLGADDFAAILVNGTQVGSVGSVTDATASSLAHAQLTPFNVSLNAGMNTITVVAENGFFAGYDYAIDPAGVVFGGTLFPSGILPTSVSITGVSAANEPLVALGDLSSDELGAGSSGDFSTSQPDAITGADQTDTLQRNPVSVPVTRAQVRDRSPLPVAGFALRSLFFNRVSRGPVR